MSSLLLESRRTSRRCVVSLPISSVTLLFRSFLSSFVALLLKLYLKLVLRRPSLAFGACWSSSPILSSSSPASCLRVFLSVLRRCSWSLASRLSSSSPVERSFSDLKLRPPSLCFLRLHPFMLRQPSCHVSCPFLEASFFCRRFLKLRPLLLELKFLSHLRRLTLLLSFRPRVLRFRLLGPGISSFAPSLFIRIASERPIYHLSVTESSFSCI